MGEDTGHSSLENDEEYKRALEILKKKKGDRLLLIRTHLELKKEAATLLAQAEEQSLDHFTPFPLLPAIICSSSRKRSKKLSARNVR